MALTVSVQPAAEPLTAAEAKLHCRVDTTDEDTLMANLIIAARQYVEEYLGRALITRTYVYTLDATTYPFELPMPPYGAITTVKSLDEDFIETTISSADYIVSTVPQVATLEITTLPADAEYLKVTYTAGYGATSAAVPQAIRQALLLLIGGWYANREAVADRALSEPPHAVKALLGTCRMQWGF